MAETDLFPGFETRRITGPGSEIFARVGGSGPPVVLLHGYPQTHMCWHRVAPALARRHRVVAMDLRGYGRSHAPAADAAHQAYSKRAMAAEVVAAMSALGHPRFSVIGHDRGGRVAYRLALDHPQTVDKLVVLDILPTIEMWERMRWSAAIASYHWAFLAQPHPLPETLIAPNARAYVDHTLASWTRAKSLAAFDPVALDDYRSLLAAPVRLRAVCEDYRAGATVDRMLDEADRAAGRRIAAPTLVVWGSDYVAKRGNSMIDVWRAWADDVDGGEVLSGHFLAEENPTDTLARIEPFLDKGSRAG